MTMLDLIASLLGAAASIPDDDEDEDMTEANEEFQEHYGVPAQSLQNAPSHAVMMLGVSALLESNACDCDEVIWKDLRRRALNEINKENPQ